MSQFEWKLPYSSQRMPILARCAVATSQPLAAQAGLRMLLRGGNAADAIVATAIALTVVEPCSNGIGSDAFCLLWDGQELHGLNASGRSPAQWTSDRFSDMTSMPQRGWDSVTVPGCVSAWVSLSRRFGKLPFQALFEPAIEYADRGFLVSPTIARLWADRAPELAHYPGFAAAFLPDGRAPGAGEIFRFPEQAQTLQLIAETYGNAFYRGELAEKMEANARQNGGVLTARDLDAHEAEWEKPLSQNYRGLTLHEMPPNTQGVAALSALGILQHFDVSSLPVDSAESVHLQLEAVKLALADMHAFVGDGNSMQTSASAMLDNSYLESRARCIDRKRARDPGPGLVRGGGTVYLSATDASGMMVSYIQSNCDGFGSGIVVDGISLQNRGSGFTLAAGHPNVVGPCKKPFQTIVPAFVTCDGEPLMSFGVMGGYMQTQGHVQVMVRLADYLQNPQAIVDAPRWRAYGGQKVAIEADTNHAIEEGLLSRGHLVERASRQSTDFGRAQLIYRMQDGYVAASDWRCDGQAVGF